jgi:hypothetical protein
VRSSRDFTRSGHRRTRTRFTRGYQIFARNYLPSLVRRGIDLSSVEAYVRCNTFRNRSDRDSDKGDVMTARLIHKVPQSEPLDVRPRPLSIKALHPRRTATPDMLARVRGEFIEMRGFSPTMEQAARLFQLSIDECSAVLGGLVQQGFLHCTADGRYRLVPRR